MAPPSSMGPSLKVAGRRAPFKPLRDPSEEGFGAGGAVGSVGALTGSSLKLDVREEPPPPLNRQYTTPEAINREKAWKAPSAGGTRRKSFSDPASSQAKPKAFRERLPSAGAVMKKYAAAAEKSDPLTARRKTLWQRAAESVTPEISRKNELRTMESILEAIRNQVSDVPFVLGAVQDVLKLSTPLAMELKGPFHNTGTTMYNTHPRNGDIMLAIIDLLYKCGGCVLTDSLELPTRGRTFEHPDTKNLSLYLPENGDEVDGSKVGIVSESHHNPRYSHHVVEEKVPLLSDSENILEFTSRDVTRVLFESIKMENNTSVVYDRNNADSIENRQPRSGNTFLYGDDGCLDFESRYECGNLRKAVRISDHEYNLYLEPDVNTKGWTQWFNFCVSNVMADRDYTFNIVNMMKPMSLFRNGMKPAIYSIKDAGKGVGWQRCAKKAGYYRNMYRKGPSEDSRVYTLSFRIRFPHDHDTVYIATGYPFSYTMLQKFLSDIESRPIVQDRYERSMLCRTPGGNRVEHLRITNFYSNSQQISARPHVVISARVHPAETGASWMMKGAINFMLSNHPIAQKLRDLYVFNIVPMLNPDGVANGNSRCSLSGADLNRQWRNPCPLKHPEIFYTKQMIRQLNAGSNQVALFCDMHGHSWKKNIFIYGCNNIHKRSVYLIERIFPKIMSELDDNFSFDDSSFLIQRAQEGTGRVVVWHEFNITNTFTMEASFCGPDIGPNKDCHFNTEMLEQAGENLCKAIFDLRKQTPDKARPDSSGRSGIGAGPMPGVVSR